VRRVIKRPKGIARLRKFRSFFLTIEKWIGEPLVLLFFESDQRAVPAIACTQLANKSKSGGKNESELL
jgi:hypothetical protein